MSVQVQNQHAQAKVARAALAEGDKSYEKAARAMKKMNETLSQREIAAQVGCSQSRVAILLRALEYHDTHEGSTFEMERGQIRNDNSPQNEGQEYTPSPNGRQFDTPNGQKFEAPEIPEEKPKPPKRMNAADKQMRERVEKGETVVANIRENEGLIQWAQSEGLYVRIDRMSAWGNPFVLDNDGDRDTVITNYRKHYLPFKPSLQDALDNLKGKVLGCWCAPEPCHGDVLKEAAKR